MAISINLLASQIHYVSSNPEYIIYNLQNKAVGYLGYRGMFAQRGPGFSGVNKADIYSSYEESRGKWSGVGILDPWLVGQSITCMVWLWDLLRLLPSPSPRRSPGK